MSHRISICRSVRKFVSPSMTHFPFTWKMIFIYDSGLETQTFTRTHISKLIHDASLSGRTCLMSKCLDWRGIERDSLVVFWKWKLKIVRHSREILQIYSLMNGKTHKLFKRNCNCFFFLFLYEIHHVQISLTAILKSNRNSKKCASTRYVSQGDCAIPQKFIKPTLEYWFRHHNYFSRRWFKIQATCPLVNWPYVDERESHVKWSLTCLLLYQ